MNYPSKYGWDKERDAELTKLWAEGYSGGQIMDKLGAPSRNSVMGRISRLKLPKRGRESSKSENRIAPPKPQKPPKPPFAGSFQALRAGPKLAPSLPKLTEDQKEYICGKGVTLLGDPKMEIIGTGKHASIRWTGGLEANQCHWIINNRQGFSEDHLFCGAPGYPYCRVHARRAWQRKVE